jgi:lysophospholipase L1-like esterase
LQPTAGCWIMSRPVYAGSESLKPEFVCSDLVHPNAAGYKAMGEFVDLGLFKTGRTDNRGR